MDNLLLTEDPLLDYQYLAIATSWRCNARCTHCFIPKYRRHQYDSNNHLLDMILRNLPESIHVIGFTGGEPFFDTASFIEEVHKVGMTGRRCAVVTNGLWARRNEAILSVLKKTYRAGLKWFSISYDLYHQPRLEQEEVIGLLRLAMKAGLAINVRGVGKGSFKLISKIKKSGVLGRREKATSNFNLDNIGEANGLPADRIKKHKSLKCLGILSPMVTPDGSVFACCSTRLFEIRNDVLRLGNIKKKPISNLLEKASRDYLLAALLVLGPRAIFKIIEPKVDINDSQHLCEFCVSFLNNVNNVRRIREKIENDRELRKKIIGKYMILRHCYGTEIHPLFYT